MGLGWRHGSWVDGVMGQTWTDLKSAGRQAGLVDLAGEAAQFLNFGGGEEQAAVF